MIRTLLPLSAQLLSVALLLAACSKDAPTDETTPVEVETSAGAVQLPPEAYLARGTWGRLDVDLVKVRSSPYYANVRELLGGAPMETDAQRDVLADVLERLDSITFALGEIEESSDLTGVLLRGSFTIDEVGRWMQGLDHGQMAPTPFELDGRVGLTMRDASVLPIDANTWILAPTRVLRESFASPAVPSSFGDPTYLEAKARPSIVDAAVRLTVLGTPGAQRLAARESPIGEEAAAHLRAATLAVAVDDGLRLEGFALLDDPTAAQALVAEATRQRDELAQQAPVAMFGLAPLVNSVELTQANADAVVRLTVSDNMVRRLIGMFGGLMALQGGGQ